MDKGNKLKMKVQNLVSGVNRRTEAGGVQEWSAEEDIWV